MAGDGGRPDAGSFAGPGTEDYAAMVARARALIPELRDRASRTEELRRLPPETERDLHDAGLFRIVQPKRVGGSELDYVALVDCADALGQADASVAWNFANLASHHWMLGMFDRRAQDAVWDKDANCADRIVLHLSGRPRQEGRWRICAERPLAVFLGRGVPANGTCSPAWFRPTMRPTASSTGYFCSTRATTRSTTPGTRPACAEPDRTMSRSPTPLLRSR